MTEHENSRRDPWTPGPGHAAPVAKAPNVLPAVGHHAEHELIRAAVQLSRMSMVISGPASQDCPIVFCNNAFLNQTGYAEHEVIGRNCRFLQGPATDPAAVARVRAAVAEGRPITEEMYNYRRDGSGFWNALYISPIFDPEGRLVYFFGSQADVTPRREAEQQQQQRMDTVGAMASGVAHEFNNLMTVIVANVEQLVGRAGDERQRRQLQRAEWAARRAGRLTQQMLTFARRQLLESREVDLGALVTGLRSTLAQVAGEGVEVALDLAETPLPVRVDPRQMELAVANLLRNAAAALPEGGRVTLSTREYRSFDAAQGPHGKAWVELSVADTGTGMAPDVARRATEPFFTTRPRGQGAGLGLSMVQGFVEQSGGRLSLASSPGAGTTVRLAFPRLED